jgi:hypothetical protein
MNASRSFSLPSQERADLCVPKRESPSERLSLFGLHIWHENRPDLIFKTQLFYSRSVTTSIYMSCGSQPGRSERESEAKTPSLNLQEKVDVDDKYALDMGIPF